MTNSAAPEHVSILGLGPSLTSFVELTKRLGGSSAYYDEVWGINAVADVIRCDRVFHMDDVLVQEGRAALKPHDNIAAMLKWLKRHPGPIYTSIPRDGYPGLVPFPLEAVLAADYDNSGGCPYYNSTTAYAIVYAIHIGVKKISLFGIDYSLANAHSAEQGRACVEFWLGIAAARGIQVVVSPTSALMDACAPERDRLYGYDLVDVVFGDESLTITDRVDAPTPAEIEARYDHKKHPNRLVREGMS